MGEVGTDRRTSDDTGEGKPGAEMDRIRVNTWIWIGVSIAVLVLGMGAWWTYAVDRGDMAMGGMGEMGFQPDVFDSAPGDDGYSPLRRVSLVEWDQQSEARILDSVEEIEDADAAGLIDVEETTVVVNMPFVTWPGGER